ncbi:MAG TPA: hypothetical protein VMV04_02975 [Thermodesulfobacteriota bacterium]|nr:hypothetical protein [Thermodesulfobacteriota bacterium]
MVNRERVRRQVVCIQFQKPRLLRCPGMAGLLATTKTGFWIKVCDYERSEAILPVG